MEVDQEQGPAQGWTWADTKTTPSNAGKIGPAYPGSGIGTSAPNRDALGNPAIIGDKARAFLNDPLVHVTGNEAVDSLFSPMNLALSATMGAPKAAELVTGAVKGLTNKMGSALAAKVLKFALPSIIKKPAELAEILAEFGKLGEVKAPPMAPSAQPSAAPITAKPSLMAGEAQEYFRLVKAGTAPKQAIEQILANRP